ncbi:hypothetical protein Pflav_043680 [Phytohabitans flavus]|uniref:Right handed beta helix domain-containing protein n=1 Tax=Phytohabitans flavus TaxID=1076124 RepID=A0A6F8XW42_9ACTN|nr:right-handed parallel beta-helix repeat-containing protein [Phytohabitans flavus]BCB77958.1 hypothetical protein Pflav_043680 [Phytohabitans flavus]
MRRRRAFAVALGTVLVLSFGLAGPAAAIPTDPSSPCLEQAFGNLKASSTNVAAGAPVALSWDTPKVANCPTLKYELETRLFGETLEANYPIQPNSSKTLSPAVNTLVILNATMGPGAKKPLDSISVAVTRTSADGRMEIVIDSSTDKALFLWAIDQPKTTIRLRDNVNLDLSYRDQLYIAEGVHILGNRGSTNPGPRIYTTTKPKRLFMIGRYLSGDGVRISGIRLDGGETAIADNGDPAPIGIAVHASVNVAIENNEIYGWAGAGVEVSDQIEGRANKLNLDNPSGVLVRDNFIHHNQHKRKFGYGVVVGTTRTQRSSRTSSTTTGTRSPRTACPAPGTSRTATSCCNTEASTPGRPTHTSSTCTAPNPAGPSTSTAATPASTSTSATTPSTTPRETW